MNIKKFFVILGLILGLVITSCTWDYDWDWLLNIGGKGGSSANFKQLTINNNITDLTGGIYSIIIGSSTYNIAYNSSHIFFNGHNDQSSFNSNLLAETGMAGPLTGQISIYYGNNSLENPQLLFNNGNMIYACSNINSDKLSCKSSPDFRGIPGQPHLISGNHGYQYAVTGDNSIYMANQNNNYSKITSPNDRAGANITGFSSMTTDINGNLYLLATYADNSTYLNQYIPATQSWHQVLNQANEISINTMIAANYHGTVFFLNPKNADATTCTKGQLKIPIGYTKDGNVKIFYALINNNCTYPINPSNISMDNSNNLYLVLANNTIFYGTMII